jgi:hypothetical protein
MIGHVNPGKQKSLYPPIKTANNSTVSCTDLLWMSSSAGNRFPILQNLLSLD